MAGFRRLATLRLRCEVLRLRLRGAVTTTRVAFRRRRRGLEALTAFLRLFFATVFLLGLTAPRVTSRAGLSCRFRLTGAFRRRARILRRGLAVALRTRFAFLLRCDRRAAFCRFVPKNLICLAVIRRRWLGFLRAFFFRRCGLATRRLTLATTAMLVLLFPRNFRGHLHPVAGGNPLWAESKRGSPETDFSIPGNPLSKGCFRLPNLRERPGGSSELYEKIIPPLSGNCYSRDSAIIHPITTPARINQGISVHNPFRLHFVLPA